MHAHVHLQRADFADRHDFALFEEPQQLGLHVERQVADFVEEQRAAGRRAHQAGLIGHRAGERAAAVAEQLTVGELARGGRAVVGKERGGAAWRADVNRAGDELLAGAALAGDQHREVVALQPLNLIDHPVHRGAGADEAGQQRLERPLDARLRRGGAALARAAQLEALAGDGGHHLHAPHHRVPRGTRRGHGHGARAVGVAADLLGDQHAGTVRGALHGQARNALGAVRHRCRRTPPRGCRRPAAARRPSPCRRRRLRAWPWRARAPAGRAARRHPPAASPAHRRHRRASRRTRRCPASARRPSPPAPPPDRAWRRAPGTPAPRSDSGGRTWTWRRPWPPAAPARAG